MTEQQLAAAINNAVSSGDNDSIADFNDNSASKLYLKDGSGTSDGVEWAEAFDEMTDTQKQYVIANVTLGIKLPC